MSQPPTGKQPQIQGAPPSSLAPRTGAGTLSASSSPAGSSSQLASSSSGPPRQQAAQAAAGPADPPVGVQMGLQQFTEAMKGAFKEALRTTENRLGETNTNLERNTGSIQALGTQIGQQNAQIQAVATGVARIAGLPAPVVNVPAPVVNVPRQPAPVVQAGNINIENALGPQRDPRFSRLTDAEEEAMLDQYQQTGQIDMKYGLNINPLTINPDFDPEDPETYAPETFIPEVKTLEGLEYYYGQEYRKMTKTQLVKEFDKIGAQYIESADEDEKELIRRLDIIKKLQVQNRAMAEYMAGQQKIPAGHTPISTFASERVTGVAKDGSPIGKVISFTNGVSQITISADGNGGYYGVQNGKKYGPRTYKEIERWAYLGGFEANEMKVLKNVSELIKHPAERRAMIFKARKL